MARRIFFSFHYQRDIFRVNVVRNSDITKKGVEQSGYWDHSLWEEVKKKGDSELQRLIESGLTNTSVTVALAGAETAHRKWVRYELVKSFERGNGMLTVWVDGIKDINGYTDNRGADPYSDLHFSIAANGQTATITQWAWNVTQWQPYMTISAASLSPAAKRLGSGQLSALASSADWVANNGYANFASWVESAAKAAGKS